LGGSCRLDIGIYWTGQGSVTSLTYSVKFFDRCTGSQQTILNRTDSGQVSKQVSWIPAPQGGFPATLPSAKAAAIVAVAQSGTAIVASAPYDLPGSAASCA